MLKRIIVDESAVHCTNCLLGHICVPNGMSPHDVEFLAELVKERIRIPKGKPLYRIGDKAEYIYSIRTGSIKTEIEGETGRSQITGFFLPGEVFGLESLNSKVHSSQAIALEDTEVCVMNIQEFEELAHRIPSLQSQMCKLITGEITRSHQLILALGAMRSEQKMAFFLLGLSNRFMRLRYSANSCLLRMSREEIGNYLGLTLETTSRLFSRFQKQGLIHIHQREVEILDKEGLQNILKGTA